jgi:hypothetical protein
LASVLVLLAWRLVGVVGLRLERMMARFAAGRPMRRVAGLRAPCVPSGGDGVEIVADGSASVAAIRVWPRQFAWMVRAAAHEAAGFGLQLQAVLAQPDMVAFLQATPQAARLLTPICRMLGVDTALLRPGFVPAVCRARAVLAVAPEPEPEPVSRVPLPRGVLAAVRRQKFLVG